MPYMNISFDNKVALVTGAAGGFGLECAKAFAQSGAKVMLADINEELLQKSTQELRDLGLEVDCLKCDVASEEQVKNLVQKTIESFGRLDCAYNNVGIHGRVTAGIAEIERADFDRVVAVNLGGIWNCMKYEIAQMLKQNSGGAIVNCSSQCGLVGLAGVSSYTASKHGVIGLTKCAALEYARNGITINAICPGTSDTPMVQQAIKDFPQHMANVIEAIPLGRMGKAQEIAALVLWLCSDYGKFTIGQAIAIDGGYTVL